MAEILAEFRGKKSSLRRRTMVVLRGMRWVLGAHFAHNRARREMFPAVASYVQKLAEKFGATKPASSPGFTER